MAETEGQQRLDLLVKQRRTNGSETVFDASQFKNLVQKDVPSNIIDQLQKEFGEDMAGAIDKFMSEGVELLKNPESGASVNDGETQNGDGGDEVDSDPLGRKHLIIRDRYWNRYKRQYEVRKPTKPSDQSKKYRNCVIFVRRDYAEDMTTFTTALVISGVVLRDALRRIFRGVEGFGLTENKSTELSPDYLFWARPELKMLLEHYQSIREKQAMFEISAALKFIESEYEEMISVLPSLLPHAITFEYLWAILPPDCLVSGTDTLGFDTIWCVRSHEVQETREGTFLVINAENIMWNGVRIGTTERPFKIPAFVGIKAIGDLPYIPLKYHPKREVVIQRVLDRSFKALEFWKPQFGHIEYDGAGLAEVHGEVEHYPFSGRVIIDPRMMQQMQPSNKILPPAWRMGNLRSVSRTCLSDLSTDEQKPEILKSLLNEDINDLESESEGEEDDDDGWDRGDNLDERKTDVSNASIPELSKMQTLLVSGLVYGYGLRESKWGAFAVNRITPIKWNSTIFESLVMDSTLKDTIYRLVVAHSRGSSEFDDFVKGKGKGLIGLFYGPPGAGKTLTAEAIAETARMPLYAVSSGALGHEAAQIHRNLADILKLASHWKAVLLLDEADVFLAQRNVTDIERNAIVSVFLRELEYYQGILLLTTNQVEVIDEAFQSRIHISLKYPDLDAAARFQIWKNFLANVRKSNGVKVDIDEDSLHSLAKVTLNGRQIKNTVSIAVKIATTSKSKTLTGESLRATLRLLRNIPIVGK